MSKVAGVIRINLTAGTAEFLADIDKANAKLKQFKTHGVSDVQATGAALRTLKGEMTNNVAAAEQFIASWLKVGPILQKAFPIVGGIAFIGMVGEGIEKAEEFYDKVTKGQERAAQAFRQVSEPLRMTNDELALANSRLEQDIAKLEGTPRNMLKVALDEARVAADRLAESLEKDLERVQKIFEEQGVSRMFGLLTGQASTADLGDKFKAFRQDVGRATDEGNLAVHTAPDKAAADVAQAAMAARLNDLYNGFVAQLEGEIATITVEKARQRELRPMNPMLNARGDDTAVREQMLDDLIRQLRLEQTGIGLQQRNTQLTARKETLELSKDQADKMRPLEERLSALDQQLESIRVKSSAVGQSDAFQVQASGYLDARKAIEQVSQALEKNKLHLTEAQKAKLADVATTIAAAQADLDWQTKLASSTATIEARVRAQQLLAESIGKGFEATRAASIDSRLMQELGPKFFDAEWMASHAGDVSKMRGQFGADFDAQQRTTVAQAIDSLSRQIDAERLLASVQKEGAYAVARAAQAVREERLRLQGATEEQIEKEHELFNVQRDNAAAANIASINERAAAVNRLAAAVLGGAQAERAAALESKYAEMSRGGASPAEIAAQRDVDRAERSQQITNEALRSGMVYRDQLDTINEQILALDRLREIHGSTFEIEVSMRDLENRRLDVLSERTLRLGRARDGVKAFFIEMQKDAETSAIVVNRALMNAFDQGSRELAKFATGQNTNFGGMLQNIGGEMVQSQTQAAIRKGASMLGGMFGVDVSAFAGKPDGTQANPIWVKMAGDVPGLSNVKLPGGTFGEGSKGRGIFSLLAGVAGFRASGGPVDPGRLYVVGERGPELFMPSTGGTVIPNGAPTGQVVHVHNHIDARGSDVGAENRVRRALAMTHQAAVTNAVRASKERMERTPR